MNGIHFDTIHIKRVTQVTVADADGQANLSLKQGQQVAVVDHDDDGEHDVFELPDDDTVLVIGRGAWEPVLV